MRPFVSWLLYFDNMLEQIANRAKKQPGAAGVGEHWSCGRWSVIRYSALPYLDNMCLVYLHNICRRWGGGSRWWMKGGWNTVLCLAAFGNTSMVCGATGIAAVWQTALNKIRLAKAFMKGAYGESVLDMQRVLCQNSKNSQRSRPADFGWRRTREEMLS